MLYPKAGNIDHIVLGPNGIFVIETKNYKGEISCYGDVWHGDYDTESYPIKSVSKQAKRNAVTLKRFIYVYSIFIFGGINDALNCEG